MTSPAPLAYSRLEARALGANPEAHRGPLAIQLDFAIDAPIVFSPDVSIDIHRADGEECLQHRQWRQDDHWAWLPRGSYRLVLMTADLDLPPGDYDFQLALWHRQGDAEHKGAAACVRLRVAERGTNPLQWSWQLSSPDIELSRLSFRRGPEDWFFKHFDHAAETVIHYFLGDSPLLRGRVLDVGCGDGITDLGIALRRPAREFIGIDPFRGYERLGEILDAAQVPSDVVPDTLEFMPADANHLPFPDDHFDVVLSWGSLEHIAGGYGRALAEIRRVLRPDGLFFVHPGLYYSDVGGHLGEFAFARAESHMHLKLPRDQLREQILAGAPDYIDRCGEFAAPEQYWQWHQELNPITVAGFEQELRALGFEPWRVALRTDDRVDYTPALQKHSFVDLAVSELYVSCCNRKPR
jgi:SAM-dependent methyltransferase